MKDFIINGFKGLIDHIYRIDNIIDLTLFIVAFVVFIWCVVTAFTLLAFAGSFLDEFKERRKERRLL